MGQLFVNGQILTMDLARPRAEALLIVGATIIAVGDRKALEARAPAHTRVIDLQGQTLLPGFVDAHSHFPSPGLAHVGLDLSPPPVGTINMLETLLARVKRAGEESKSGSWIVGFNYDNTALDIGRHPTRMELDQVAPHHPVYLWHRSGHMGVGNSLALRALGHADGTVTAPAAAALDVGRDAEGRLTGLLQEGAAPETGRAAQRIAVEKAD